VSYVQRALVAALAKTIGSLVFGGAATAESACGVADGEVDAEEDGGAWVALAEAGLSGPVT
jgi:FlaG/FlaF family flagellin (archaellin)